MKSFLRHLYSEGKVRRKNALTPDEKRPSFSAKVSSPQCKGLFFLKKLENTGVRALKMSRGYSDLFTLHKQKCTRDQRDERMKKRESYKTKRKEGKQRESRKKQEKESRASKGKRRRDFSRRAKVFSAD